MKFLETFFATLGLTDLRFKPAFNPYTEPSMEIFGFHAGLDKWVEIGNSGMFRPEMLEPMGLPKDMRVYGFGLSLERPTMIRYKVRLIPRLNSISVPQCADDNSGLEYPRSPRPQGRPQVCRGTACRQVRQELDGWGNGRLCQVDALMRSCR
jgi:O-phosphoseryl-tRNA(Cys) synthetase